MTTHKSKRLENERLVYDAIATWGTQSYGPSFRDVALATNLPLGTVHEVARDLREQGRVTFTDRIARSLRVVA